MPRVHHVKKAAKDNPVCKKGESYYWWKFRFGGKHFSKTYPRPSQTTGSDKLSRVLAAEEDVQDFCDTTSSDSLGELAQALEDASAEVREVGEEYSYSADSIRDNFSESPTADECEEKSQQCEEAADECDQAAGTVQDLDREVQETKQELEGLEQVVKPDEETREKIAELCQVIEDKVSEAIETASNIPFEVG